MQATGKLPVKYLSEKYFYKEPLSTFILIESYEKISGHNKIFHGRRFYEPYTRPPDIHKFSH